METEQAPHEKLNEEQIKQMICDLQLDIINLESFCIESIYNIEQSIYKLKRHFCPEKFQVKKVSMGQMMELMKEAYPNPLGEPINFPKKFESLSMIDDNVYPECLGPRES